MRNFLPNQKLLSRECNVGKTISLPSHLNFCKTLKKKNKTKFADEGNTYKTINGLLMGFALSIQKEDFCFSCSLAFQENSVGGHGYLNGEVFFSKYNVNLNRMKRMALIIMPLNCGPHCILQNPKR